MTFEEKLTQWTWRGVKVELFSLGRETFSLSQRAKLGYRIYSDNVLLFEDADFYPSPLHSCDGLHSIIALLTFHKEKDENQSYSPEQLAWYGSFSFEEIANILADFDEFEIDVRKPTIFQPWVCPICVKMNFSYGDEDTCAWCGFTLAVQNEELLEVKEDHDV